MPHLKLNYQKLHGSAVNLSAVYLAEQAAEDGRRYFSIMRGATKNADHEEWGGFVRRVADSFPKLKQDISDKAMEDKFSLILFQTFSFVLSRLITQKEGGSALARCCLHAMGAEIEDFNLMVMDCDYKALLSHIQWVSEPTNQPEQLCPVAVDERSRVFVNWVPTPNAQVLQLHPSISNRDLATQIRSYAKTKNVDEEYDVIQKRGRQLKV